MPRHCVTIIPGTPRRSVSTWAWNTTTLRQYQCLEHHNTAPVPVPGTSRRCVSACTCAWNTTTLRQHMCLKHHDAASAPVLGILRRCVSTCTWNTTMLVSTYAWNTTTLRQHLCLDTTTQRQYLCLEHHDTAPTPVPGTLRRCVSASPRGLALLMRAAEAANRSLVS